MKLTDSARTVLETRYLRKNPELQVVESPEQMLYRVADALANDDTEREIFFNMMDNLFFLPNSPCLMNAGTPLNQMSACFVLPIDDHIESIYDTLKHQAQIHKTGGGTGFSFGHLRPRGDYVSGSESVASGPVSFLRVYDASTAEIKQGGRRRGANMATLPIWHQDVMEFITCKDQHNQAITNFNISVWVSEEFMQAVEMDGVWHLYSPRDMTKIVHTVKARELFDAIVQRAWLTGDPGMLFDQAMNKDNPTPWVGLYETTNPCGEQPLLPYEACVLGSINLAKFVVGSVFDLRNLELVARDAAKLLDRCIDKQDYILPEIAAMHRDGNRKIGLGVMGWADALSMMDIPYDSPEARRLATEVMAHIRQGALDYSLDAYVQYGPFPNYNPSQATYAPRRNATLTTIAPTGTISVIAGCSSGIEPHFALAIRRENVLGGKTLYDVNPVVKKRFGADVVAYVEEFGKLPDSVDQKIRDSFKTAHEISVEDQLLMQSAFQRYTDNAVSKTINMNHEDPPEAVHHAYMMAWRLGLKGITIYRDGSKTNAVTGAPIQVLHDNSKAIQPAYQQIEVLEAGVPYVHERPSVCYGMTERVATALGSLYVTVNRNGKDRPFEVLAQIGHGASDVAAFTEGLARLTSLALRSEIPADVIAEQLVGIGGSRSHGLGPNKVLSVPDAIGRVLLHVAEQRPDGQSSFGVELCPSCHQGTLAHQEGCVKCMSPDCGYSEC